VVRLGFFVVLNEDTSGVPFKQFLDNIRGI